MDRPVYSLHLFAGAGGGLLADLLAGVRPVCAVEIERYPQRVLAKRFPGLPIWDDVQTFRADNPDCADAFRWLREHRDALVVAGGFPCQDISCAGKGGGVEGGEKSGLWREFARILGEVRPRYAFVENSPFLVGRGLGIVLCDLAALGYDARWQVLAAGDVGARHLRERIWIAAALRDGVRVGGQVRSEAFRSSTPTPVELLRARNIPDGDGQRQRQPLRADEGRTPVGGGRAMDLSPRYPTQQAHDAVAGTSRPHGWGVAQRNLNDLAVQYPTPRAHDRLPGGGF